MTTLAVYDCMLFLRAAARPRLARPLFNFIHDGRVTICLSAAVLEEIRDVLTRPKLIAKFPALTPEAVQEFLTRYVAIATWIDDVTDQYVLVRDPDDSKYINLAIAATASFVVTDDLALLELMDSNSFVGSEFRQQYPKLTILTPAQFEEMIVGQGSR